jgi:hypothetical protein
MNNKPIAFIRPDDYAVFSSNENGTFSLHPSKTHFPDALHSEYSDVTLYGLGFHVVYATGIQYIAPKEHNCGDVGE